MFLNTSSSVVPGFKTTSLSRVVLEADFHMIADRNKVCDHMETYFCDRLRSCDHDRRRSQKIELCSISRDHLRSIAIVRLYGNQSFAIRDRNASHNISSSLPRFNARVFDCRNDLRYECVYRSRKDFNDKNKQQSSYWDKIGQKIHLSAEEAEAKFLQHKNCIPSLSNPKPMFSQPRFQGLSSSRPSESGKKRRLMFSTVLELATTRLIMANRRSKFAHSKFVMLFFFEPTRACIFDVFADQNVCLRSALRSLRLYGNSPFFDRLRLFAICDLR